MANSGNLIAKVPLSWKKLFSMGVVIPHKLRNCSDSPNDILSESSDEIVNQTKEISANLKELKRQIPDKFGYMLPRYEKT